MTLDDTSSRRSYGKTAKIGMLWTGVRRIGTEALALPTAMILARLLAPSDFGVAAAARILLVLAARITQFGFTTALVRRRTLQPEHLSSVLVLGLGTGTLAWMIFFFSAPAIGRFFGAREVADIVPVAALAFMITPWGGTAQVLLSRRMQYRRMTVATWTKAVVEASVSVVLAWQGYGFWSLIYGHLAGSVANSTIKVYLAKWRPRFAFSVAAIRDVWSYGMGIQSKRLLDYLANRMDSVLVGRLLGVAALGFYDKAFDSIQRLAGRVAIGQGVTFRILAIIKDDPPRFQKAYRKLLLATGLIVYPLFLTCILVAPQLFTVMFGSRWLPVCGVKSLWTV